MAAAPHMDPKVLLHRKLGSSWSSPELVALLQTRPGLLSDILCIFRGLEQPLRVRACVRGRLGRDDALGFFIQGPEDAARTGHH